jgi:hypothetical protein
MASPIAVKTADIRSFDSNRSKQIYYLIEYSHEQR